MPIAFNTSRDTKVAQLSRLLAEPLASRDTGPFPEERKLLRIEDRLIRIELQLERLAWIFARPHQLDVEEEE